MNEECSKLFRVQKTCLKLLKNRGYVVQDDWIDSSIDVFQQRYGETPSREALTLFVQKSDSIDDQMFVFFPDSDKKVGVTNLSTYVQRMKDQKVHNAIVIVKVDLTPFAKTFLREVASHKIKIEYFKESELLIDITEHKYVPQHIVLSEQEKQDLLERYRLKEFQLPRILVTDPIARYYGLTPKQVVKIIRPSETAGRYVTYRICQ